MSRYFDAHRHLALPAATPPPAKGGGEVFGRMICAVAPSDWEAIAAVAPNWPGARAAYGIHPWRAADAPENWPELLEERLRADPAAWVGEIGLDGRHAAAGEHVQRDVFRRQLRLAGAMSRRVNLHCVKAWRELLDLLDADYPPDGKTAFVVHAFGGPHQYVALLAERGAYFSVGPPASRRDSPRRRTRAALIPEERLLLESDRHLPPGEDDAEGLARALSWLAGARNADAETLAAAIEANSRRLFDA